MNLEFIMSPGFAWRAKMRPHQNGQMLVPPSSPSPSEWIEPSQQRLWKPLLNNFPRYNLMSFGGQLILLDHEVKLLGKKFR
jgi:hypothetical protein